MNPEAITMTMTMNQRKLIDSFVKEHLKEVSEDSYNKVKSNMRVHMTKSDYLSLPINLSQLTKAKPYGLWYGIGTEWIDWVRFNMPEWESPNLFEIIVDESNILKIETPKELEEFTRAFRDKSPKSLEFNEYVFSINWSAVASFFAGIEISPYHHSMRMNNYTSWYYTWDVASGCIWDESGIKEIKKL